VNNGRYRESRQIGRKPAANLHHATRVADRIGRPLNQFVTINYSLTACPPREASAAFRRLLASWYARWLRRHRKLKGRCPPTHVWVFEAAGGQVAVHWAVHIPRGLVREFRRSLPLWIAATVGEPVPHDTVKHRSIYNVTGLKRYVLKGMDPHFAPLWKIRPVPQGLIVGKRSGFSRNLGPTARARVGYRPQRHLSTGWTSEATA
jgi:hypothetical protein